MTPPRPVPTPALLEHAAGPIASIGVLIGLHLLAVGHDAPGGGFVAGLVVGASVALHRLAGAPSARRDAPLAKARVPLATGALFVAATVLAPVVSGDVVASTGTHTIDLGLIGTFKITSALVFDIGVLLIVVGLVLAMLQVAVGSDDA